MLILDPGHRSTHACTDTLGVNTISSERTGKNTQRHYKNKHIYGVKERGCIFLTAYFFTCYMHNMNIFEQFYKETKDCLF